MTAPTPILRCPAPNCQKDMDGRYAFCWRHRHILGVRLANRVQQQRHLMLSDAPNSYVSTVAEALTRIAEMRELREVKSPAIARCDAELKAIEEYSGPPEKAYLVAMGANDWQTEKDLLEKAAQK